MADKKDDNKYYDPNNIKLVKIFSKFTSEYREKTKKERESQKREAKHARDDIKGLNDSINKTTEKLEKIEDDRRRLEKEIEAKNAEMAKMGNFSEEFKEAKKDRQKLLDAQERNKNESLRMEEASLDLEKNKVKRDRAQELITEENKREQKWHGRMMLKGLGKLEGALTNSFKKVGKAGWVGFKAALLATGILLLLRFLESKKWQEIKNWLKKEGKEIFDTLTTALGAMWKYFAGPDSIFKRIAKIMKALDAIWNPEKEDHGTGIPLEGDTPWWDFSGTWDRIKNAWKTMGDNLDGWEIAFIAAVTAIGGYFIYKPLRLLYKATKGLTLFAKTLFTGKYGIWTGMTWVKDWIKGFGKAVNPTPKQLELFKAPQGGWFAKIGKGFLSIIARFKSALAIAIAEAGNVLAKLTSKLPGVVSTISQNAPIAKGVKNLWKPAASALRGGATGSKGRFGGLGRPTTKLTSWERPAMQLGLKGSQTVKAMKLPPMLSRDMGASTAVKELLSKAAATKVGGKALTSAQKIAKFMKAAKIYKAIPGLGAPISLAIGAGLAGMYLAEDPPKWTRASLELFSGILGMFPFAGASVALALDAGLATNDLTGKDELTWKKILSTPILGQMQRNKQAMTTMRPWQRHLQEIKDRSQRKKLAADLGVKGSYGNVDMTPARGALDILGATMTAEQRATIGLGDDVGGWHPGAGGNKLLVNQDNSTTLTSGGYWPMVNPEPKIHTGSIYSAL